MEVLDRWRDQMVAVFRIVVGFLFACHGVASLFGVLGKRQAELFAWPSWWAAAIQLVGGVLVLAGLWTRYAALISSGSMAYAYFMVHQQDGLLPLQNNGEKAALFCFAFLLIAFIGNGTWSLESKRDRESKLVRAS